MWPSINDARVRSTILDRLEVSKLSEVRRLPVAREGRVRGVFWRCTGKIIFIAFKKKQLIQENAGPCLGVS